MKKFVCFASGGGTNFQALINSAHNRQGEAIALITDSFGIGAAGRALNLGIPLIEYSYKELGYESYFEAVLGQLERLKPDLMVLCGFIRKLPKEALDICPAINVHPSLLPSFSGKGMHGLKVHEAALSYGVKVSGCTVHFVDSGLDTGPIIFQKAVEVLNSDTPESLSERVLKYEHELLPKAAGLFLEGKIHLDGRKALISDY